MTDDAVYFLAFVGGCFLGLGLLGAWFDRQDRRRRRDPHPARVTPPSAVSASLPLPSVEAERQRKAFTWLMEDLKRTAAQEPRWGKDSVGKHYYTVADVLADLDHRGSQR